MLVWCITKVLTLGVMLLAIKEKQQKTWIKEEYTNKAFYAINFNQDIIINNKNNSRI